MCIAIQKDKPICFSFDHDQLDYEVAIMRLIIHNLLNKVEENNYVNKGNSFKQFKESLKNIDHENLKK